MIDLRIEKERHMSAQDAYDILSFAIQAAEDNGFINSFIYERALYEFAAIILMPDYKDAYSHVIAENVNEAWDEMLEAGILDELVDNFSMDVDYLATLGQKWIEDFTDYIHSARGLLNSIQEFTGALSQDSLENLFQAAKETHVDEVLKIAQDWNMNNTALASV